VQPSHCILLAPKFVMPALVAGIHDHRRRE
jgi:hypothetical protein